MSKCCCGSNDEINLLFPCSGGADLGELADRVARRMAAAGLARISCLAGVGADISGFVVSARDADQVITIDGCPLRCAAKNLQNRDIATKSFVLSDLGYEKGLTAVTEETVEAAFQILAAELKKSSEKADKSPTKKNSKDSGCGCGSC
ncbi:MAG: putative zinc-binding protein [Candidatus Cloacimonadales bacterium]